MMFFSFLFEKKPFNTGYLPEEGGHQVFFQEFGNPKGLPVISFHGGPGSFSKPKHTDNYNLKKHRVILFDQRGGGKSLPKGLIENNSALDLVHDAKRILDLLKIEKAIVAGGSWGSTLALMFAEAYPETVTKLIITQTFLARKQDVDWIVETSSGFYPDIMAKIKKPVPAGNTVREYYSELALSDKLEDRQKAASLYGSYERMLGRYSPRFSDELPTEDHMDAFRLYMHYDRLNYVPEENYILNRIKTIENIPTLIVHNRLDMVCLCTQSWELHKALKNSKLVIAPGAGHSNDRLHKRIKEEVEKFLEA